MSLATAPKPDSTAEETLPEGGASGAVVRAPAQAPALPVASAPRIVGAPKAPLSDFYHAFLRMPWWAALGLIVVGYLLLNVGFAVAFVFTGGIANARVGAFPDAFWFSIQTMGTIGYGAMYPTSVGANLIVVFESVVGLLVTALSTGLVFAKFARSTARIVFSRDAVISPMDGVPTLTFRLGNERSNLIMEAHLHVVLARTERTKEGVMFYRMYDLKLTRERSQALTRSWTVMHPIVPGSPLYGQTPETLKATEAELMVSVAGVDDTSRQPVHARKTYTDDRILWGARHADVITEEPDGTILVDLRRFHDVLPTAPTDDFPYPAARSASLVASS